MSDVDRSIPDVVGLGIDTALRIMNESDVEVEVLPLQDWSSRPESICDGPPRVVCQRVLGQRHVVLLVAPDMYRQTGG